MQKHKITHKIIDKEAICLITLFILGSTLITGISSNAKNDAWISVIIGMVFSVPMFLIYSRIISIIPDKGLFEILIMILGKYLGKFVSVLYVWYAFHLGALVIRDFAEFVSTVTMPETPMLVVMMSLIFVCIIAVKLGIEAIGRMTTYFMIIIITILLMVQVFAIPQLRIENIKPILRDIAPVLQGGFSAFTFPFAETVVAMGIFSSLETKRSPYKIYFSGLIFAGTIITILTLRNIAILGGLLDNLYFPSHVAVSQIRIGYFLQRMEVTVAFAFTITTLIKVTVCLLAVCKGIACVFNLKEYKSITIQTGILMTFLSYILHDNVAEMVNWTFEVYPYYAFPFQVILPIIIWVAAEIRIKSERNKKRTVLKKNN